MRVRVSVSVAVSFVTQGPSVRGYGGLRIVIGGKATIFDLRFTRPSLFFSFEGKNLCCSVYGYDRGRAPEDGRAFPARLAGRGWLLVATCGTMVYSTLRWVGGRCTVWPRLCAGLVIMYPRWRGEQVGCCRIQVASFSVFELDGQATRLADRPMVPEPAVLA